MQFNSCANTLLILAGHNQQPAAYPQPVFLLQSFKESWNNDEVGKANWRGFGSSDGVVNRWVCRLDAGEPLCGSAGGCGDNAGSAAQRLAGV
jgi:hypothetical protein